MDNLLVTVVITERGGKHGISSRLDCEHIFALRWTSSSLKQTPAACMDMDMHDWITVIWYTQNTIPCMHVQIIKDAANNIIVH